MRCEVIDCGATAVATVIQVTHQASPGAQHAACRGHAIDARGHGCHVVEMHNDEITWEPTSTAAASPCQVYARSHAVCSLGTHGCGAYHGR